MKKFLKDFKFYIIDEVVDFLDVVAAKADSLQISFSFKKAFADFLDNVVVSHEDFQVDGVFEQIWIERFDLKG